MTEWEFRLKYPHSTDEQVRLYAEAVKAEAARPPVIEPDIPMPVIRLARPVITVPEPGFTITDCKFIVNDHQATTYSMPGGTMRDILLGFKNSGLSPEQRQQFQHMSDEDMLAMFFDPQMFRPEAWH